MAGEFLSGYSVGASTANMRVMRQERMMELKAQEAHRQIQERTDAARVQMLTEHYLRADQLNQQKIQTQNAAAKAIGAMFEDNKAKGLPDDENLASLIAPASAVDPGMGSKLALAYQRQQAGKAASVKSGQSTDNMPKGATVNGVDVIYSPKSGHFIKAKGSTLGPADKAELGAIYTRIKALQKAHDILPTDPNPEREWDKTNKGDVGKIPNRIQRMKLSAAIAGLKAQARALESGHAALSGSPDAEKVRVKNVKTGQFGHIPAAQLDAALNSKEYEEAPSSSTGPDEADSEEEP